MKYPSKKATWAGRSRMALQTSLVFGAAAAMFAGTSVAAMSDDGTSNFRDKFINQVIKGSEINGWAGIYDFRRWNNLNTEKDSASTDFGLVFKLHTGQIYGFSAGLGYVFEKGFYDAGPYRGPQTNLAVNPNLGGSDQLISEMNQLYLQYNFEGGMLRWGRQIFKIPFASFDRFAFTPRAFRGVSGVIEPLKWFNGQVDSGDSAQPADLSLNGYNRLSAGAANGQTWKLFAAKIFKVKRRGGDEDFGDDGALLLGPTGNGDTPGFWSIGTTYHLNTSNGNAFLQAYHHTFQTIENLEYVEGGYMWEPDGSAMSPYIMAQYVHASDTSDSQFDQYGGIKADVFGLKLGFQTDIIDMAIFGNYSVEHDDAVGHGILIHPYVDLSTYVYTDTMNDGIQETGPGWALGASTTITPQGALTGLSFSGKFAWYHAKHAHGHKFYSIGSPSCTGGPSGIRSDCGSGDSWGLNVGIGYNLGAINPALEGLSVSNTLGVTHFQDYVAESTFYDNRFRLTYSF